MGILKREEKILIAKRPLNKPYGGYWEFPGGKIEKNESNEAALKRELYEELGIHIQIAKEMPAYAHHYPDKTVLLNPWIVIQFSGEPYGREGQNLAWVFFAELARYQLLEGSGILIDQMK